MHWPALGFVPRCLGVVSLQRTIIFQLAIRKLQSRYIFNGPITTQEMVPREAIRMDGIDQRTLLDEKKYPETTSSNSASLPEIRK